ncbi:MAG: hypothetical protein NPIRA03_25160 [Nitrospirales bacterium]|nr:MAG: hypothetical protein NPIRA03_25160 [Nitrospirales bacterium]
MGLYKILETSNVIGLKWHTFGYLGDPRITGGAKEFPYARGLRKLPYQSMLPAPVAYD